MLDRFLNRDDDARDDSEIARRREALVRDRMQASGISEEEARRIVLSEEELAIGKREVRAGEVGIHKRVETEHVRENVTLRHDEVDVERRPVTGMRAGDAAIGTDEEIRVPLRAEEAVVEKRVVPKEELVVRTREVSETKPVEADLRRERAEVIREGSVRETDRMDAGSTVRRDGLDDRLDDGTPRRV